jgi:hypothetical protein
MSTHKLTRKELEVRLGQLSTVIMQRDVVIAFLMDKVGATQADLQEFHNRKVAEFTAAQSAPAAPAAQAQEHGEPVR